MKRAIALILALLMIGCAALAESYVLAVADPTWVRSSPNLGENIVDQLVTGNTYQWGGNVRYDSRGIAWYDVVYSGKYGWISSLHGNLIDGADGSAHNDTSVAIGNGTSIRANSEVNVRTGPGTEYAVIGTMYAGETADYTGTSKKAANGKLWYQINYYNSIGWVSASYASVY